MKIKEIIKNWLFGSNCVTPMNKIPTKIDTEQTLMVALNSLREKNKDLKMQNARQYAIINEKNKEITALERTINLMSEKGDIKTAILEGIKKGLNETPVQIEKKKRGRPAKIKRNKMATEQFTVFITGELLDKNDFDKLYNTIQESNKEFNTDFVIWNGTMEDFKEKLTK